MNCCRCQNKAKYRADVWVDSAEDVFPAYVLLCGMHKNVLERHFIEDEADILWSDIISYNNVELIPEGFDEHA